jgi:cardiolipin synthase
MITKQIPNILTISRLILIFPFLYLLYTQSFTFAFYMFLGAGVTDGLDGWLARSFRWQSWLGSFLDPIADKLLIATSFISLALLEKLPWWLVILVFLRDITISLGAIAWFFLLDNQINFKPTRLSKANTVLQLLLVTICLFELAYQLFPSFIVFTLVLLTAVTTIGSYVDYVWTWGHKAANRTQAQ